MTGEANSGPLAGTKVVEFAGIGPAPMCGMLLADLGADVLRIDRPIAGDVGIKRPLETNFILRGRQSIQLDLKDPLAVACALEFIEIADCLIEGFRPGVMERLGLGPEVVKERNPRLVFGRVTGWGQSGPRSQTAGHDVNYIALTGALEAMGRRGERPPVPLNLIGDFAGGALFLALGLLAGLLDARQSGHGQVVDAAIVDGVSSMLTSINGLRASGVFSRERGSNILDAGAPFYNTYECLDGKFVAVGPIEARFFREFLVRLGLTVDTFPQQNDREAWPEGAKKLAEIFRSRTRDEWAALFAESDACVTGVLSLEESFEDPHMLARGTPIEIGKHVQAAPAPRFDRTVPANPLPPAEAVPLQEVAGWLSRSRLLYWQESLK